MMTKRKRISLLLFVFFMMFSVIVSAQFPPEEDDVEDVHFDGGVSLLVAAGIGYGVKKVRDQRKKNIKNSAN